MDFRKTVIVTGAANGIGRDIAENLLNKDYNTAVIDIDTKSGDEMARRFPVERFFFMAGDIGDTEVIEKFVKKTLGRFGQLYGLINNAAVASPGFNGDLSAWDTIMAVNLRAPFYLSKLCRLYLKKSKGAIVNIASTRALMSEPNTEAYSASKGGLLSLTHSLAASFAPDIRVNAISPGWIHTKKEKLSKRDHKQHFAGRVGCPADISEMAEYLLSEKAKFITGQNFIIDGGMTKKMIYE
ncbi:MAG: SDR family oxidoreductase [Spirochaetia bacterium]|nr:SDR family oxidoreductase [Spirochaetia bacterium]